MFKRSECPACEGSGVREGERFTPAWGASNCERVDVWVECRECVDDEEDEK